LVPDPEGKEGRRMSVHGWMSRCVRIGVAGVALWAALGSAVEVRAQGRTGSASDRSPPPPAPVANAPGSPKKCADEAMALLKQAVAKGYKNAAHMKQDKDLAPLCQRDDFKKLVAELEGKE
jgi:hypothetical protein